MADLAVPTQRSSPASVHRTRSGRRAGDLKLALILIAPAILGFGVFTVYPTIRGLYLSLTKYSLLAPPKWVGLDNYIRMFSDGVFWQSVWVTLYYVLLTVVFTVLFAVLTAVVLHRLTKSTLVRGLIILPFLVSNVVAGMVWTWMLDPQAGIVNHLITAFGLDHISFLGQPAWVVPTLAWISVWKSMGYTALLVFAGLQTIPGSVYEAGRLDGASERNMFFSITLPLLRPIMALVGVITILSSFQVFDIVAVTTKGGPVNSSNVLQMYIYNLAFGQFDYGYASAISVGMFVILLAVTFIQLRVTRADQSDVG